MPTIAYEKWRPKDDAIEVVNHAIDICSTYAAQGYDLTLRQLYYQFVARGLIPNTQRDYNRLGEIINRARLAGYLDWDYIVDRTRNLESLSHWRSPDAIIDAAANSFRFDKWADQPVRVEVWVEKEALAGVISQVADRHDVAWFSCRGYVSQSELWRAAQRHRQYLEDGQAVCVLHLGDHDPSGIDMTRDIEDRLHKFIYAHWYTDHKDEIESARYGDIAYHMYERVTENRDKELPVDRAHVVRRIALNFDQVQEYEPPPNPAKITDSRARGYIEEHGGDSWELDALEPQVLDALIEQHVTELRDEELWEAAVAREEQEREVLTAASSRWGEVADFLNGDKQ